MIVIGKLNDIRAAWVLVEAPVSGGWLHESLARAAHADDVSAQQKKKKKGG
jgi:hypothetical protein